MFGSRNTPCFFRYRCAISAVRRPTRRTAARFGSRTPAAVGEEQSTSVCGLPDIKPRASRLLRVAISLTLLFAAFPSAAQTLKRSNKQVVSGGVLQKNDAASIGPDSLARNAADSLAAERADSLAEAIGMDSATRATAIDAATEGVESDADAKRRRKIRLDKDGNERIRQPLFSDSSSLAKVCWTSAVLPGYGQIYNRQYWKLPLLYSTLGASIGMAIHERNEYRPLKRRYDELTAESMSRTEELNLLQRRMIRTNTKRQIFWMTAAASYIYFLGDAAVNYSTNEVSSVKKATTLSIICPGAGQIYNKSYWKVPIVIGGMASMVYVIDWNNRGFQRFKKAYALRADFDANPGNYPDGVSHDEFKGRYSATYLKNLRDAYRRNRDLSIILTAAVYAFQAIDAHVDAHLKDFDVSDDLTVDLQPMFDYQYSHVNGTYPVFGFNLNITF